MSLVGARVLRKEDPKLITGRGQFVDDLNPAGTAYVAFATSDIAHGRINSIDTEAASAIEGVLAVWTAEDVSHLPPPPGVPGLERPLLATEKVRFVGEPVAVVAATSRGVAADAAAAIFADIEPLPAVTSVGEALADDAPVLDENVGANAVFHMPDENADIEQALADAPRRTNLHVVNNRCAAVPIEPNVILADADPDGLTVWVTHQAPHKFRTALAAYFGMPQDTVRVVAPDVGGGFGAKINDIPEFYLVPALSRALGRPVKFTQTRSDCMLSMYHGRAQESDIEIGYDEDGNLLALRVHVHQDQGAYADPTGMGLPALTTTMAGGCYRIPTVGVSWTNVLTNTTPVAAYRGAGRPEASYNIERVIDVVADELGMDAVDIRRQNFVPADAFPYQSHSEIAVYDSGNYSASLDELLRLMDYDSLKAEQAANLADDSKPLLGIGFSCWLEIAAFGPPGSLEAFGHLGSWESAQVRIQPDGSAIIYTGASPHGQGTETTLAQIAGDELGIDFDRISVRHGDTDTIVQGIGTMGSRITAIAGESVKQASATVTERAKAIAAHILEANPDDLEVADDQFHVAGTPAKSVSWAEVATKSFQPLEIPEGLDTAALNETVHFAPPNFTFPAGAYGCVVEIDRATAAIRVRDMVLVDDCGTVINPLLAEGQVHGGVAQGVAQALYEKMEYNEDGQPLTATLVDYLVPAAPDLPEYQSGRTVTPTPSNSLGAKGIGESGSVGAPPAVVNAAVDALSHLGVTHIDMPVTPKKVFAILHGGGS
ncbi:MAG: xanthine dehydrogenase family protein molybdopterin-binding subunit [Acidimicrobiales bacterium]